MPKFLGDWSKVKKLSFKEKQAVNRGTSDLRSEIEPHDPVCGMALLGETAYQVEFEQGRYFFCSKLCRDYFLRQPQKYLSETPLIEFRSVSKIFLLSEGVEVPALRRIDLKVFKGDFIAIIGPSGSGKSTLMNIIGLLDSPTQGAVFLKGENVADFSEDKLARLRSKTIGFVFQQFNLLPHLNAQENITLPFAFTSNTEEHLQAEKVLGQVGLLERKHHRPNQLSGGEQQRVAIARALINNPEILIADEPTGNLDSKTGEKIIQILAELNQQGRTLIIVTHDPSIASLAEKIFHIKDGVIQQDHEVGSKFLWENKK